MTPPFRFFPSGGRAPQIRELLGRFTTHLGGSTLTFDPHDILGIDPHDHRICGKDAATCPYRAEITYLDPDPEWDPIAAPRWMVTEEPDILVERLNAVLDILALRGTP